MDGAEVDLAAVTGTAASGVEGGEALTAFVDAVMTRDEVAITDARGKVEAQLGAPALIDAAAVLANFQRMVRIADATGIPLDAPVQLLTQDIREDLGINAFGSAGRSPALSWPKRILGRLLAPFAPKLLKRIAARRRNRST